MDAEWRGRTANSGVTHVFQSWVGYEPVGRKVSKNNWCYLLWNGDSLKMKGISTGSPNRKQPPLKFPIKARSPSDSHWKVKLLKFRFYYLLCILCDSTFKGMKCQTWNEASTHQTQLMKGTGRIAEVPWRLSPSPLTNYYSSGQNLWKLNW